MSVRGGETYHTLFFIFIFGTHSISAVVVVGVFILIWCRVFAIYMGKRERESYWQEKSAFTAGFVRPQALACMIVVR